LEQRVRLIHTSDWQIGKTLGFADDATREVLRNERLDAILRLGRLAQQNSITTILVAGDVYDVASPTDKTLRQPIERMRQFPGIRWHLIPGNHDPHTPSGAFDRLGRMGLPENVALHVSPQSANIGEGAFLLPAVLTRRHAAGDPTDGMDQAATPDAAIRIGLAHGSVTSFGSDPGQTHNLIAFDRPDRAGLAYLALGDWHGAQIMAPRIAYSGTPEQDGFDLGGRGGGEALIVEIEGARALPTIQVVRTGGYVWRRDTIILDDDSSVGPLEARLRALHTDLSHLLVQLKVVGMLSVEGREVFDRQIRDGIGSAVCALRIDDSELRLQPTAADVALLARAGAAGVAAERLSARAEDPNDPQSDLARAALLRLYVLHARHERTI
jgi:DNA repair exonuclease SbcCD nuclease subunit